MRMPGEVTFCPRCGNNLSNPQYLAKFHQASSLDWTGKIRCPVCNFFGFFLTAPPSEYEKIEFTSEPLPQEADYSDPAVIMEQEHTGWLAFIIAITVVAALAYLLATSV